MSNELMTKEEMIHFRVKNEDGSINPCGGVTVCYYVTKDGTRCFIGVAICSMLDNYRKKLGAVKARGNAKRVEKRAPHADHALLCREDMFELATKYANSRWYSVCANRGWNNTTLATIGSKETVLV